MPEGQLLCLRVYVFFRSCKIRVEGKEIPCGKSGSNHSYARGTVKYLNGVQIIGHAQEYTPHLTAAPSTSMSADSLPYLSKCEVRLIKYCLGRATSTRRLVRVDGQQHEKEESIAC